MSYEVELSGPENKQLLEKFLPSVEMKYKNAFARALGCEMHDVNGFDDDQTHMVLKILAQEKMNFETYDLDDFDNMNIIDRMGEYLGIEIPHESIGDIRTPTQIIMAVKNYDESLKKKDSETK